MESPPVPDNEAERLESLHNLDILDTESEYRFDRITRLAARSLNTEFSEINLIDDDRQWSKSQYGTRDPESPREISFCAHVIANDELTVIPDARKDSRFKDNPNVTGYPHIRFYMAVPIRSPEVHNVGTLCAFDSSPRSPSDNDIKVLREFASMAEEQLQQSIDSFPELGEPRMKVTEIINEVQHQVRNNLQVILSLLGIKRNETNDEDLREFCWYMEDRVGTITTLYDCLDEADESVRVNMEQYVESLLQQIFQHHKPPQSIKLDYETDSFLMSLERAPLVGLLLHELVANALEHAFSVGKSGSVRVTFQRKQRESDGEHYWLSVSDTGQGLPDSFDWRTDGSLGMTLIRNITENKFDGTLEYATGEGTTVTVDFH
ncbi:MAG: histidine kinase dimerization/phosphoacceptor domain -containing protein [bacterium]